MNLEQLNEKMDDFSNELGLYRKVHIDCIRLIDKVTNDFNKRLNIIEDLFAEKTFKPIHEAMETYVEVFAKRLENIENRLYKLQEKNTELMKNL